MRFLVDTHVALWSLHLDPQLSAKHAELISSDADLIFSVASIWEVAIKRSLGKLILADNYLQTMVSADYQILSIKPEHAQNVGHLPMHHRDLFDRMLVAQAQLEGLVIMTSNNAFQHYDVQTA